MFMKVKKGKDYQEVGSGNVLKNHSWKTGGWEAHRTSLNILYFSWKGAVLGKIYFRICFPVTKRPKWKMEQKCYSISTITKAFAIACGMWFLNWANFIMMFDIHHTSKKKSFCQQQLCCAPRMYLFIYFYLFLCRAPSGCVADLLCCSPTRWGHIPHSME